MKPKIPKLTKKERRMWIKALKEVLNSYKNKGFNFCPLCKMGYCKHCVWTWFTGKDCVTYNKLKLKKRKYFDFSNPRWVKFRVRQIPRWIKKLEENL